MTVKTTNHHSTIYWKTQQSHLKCTGEPVLLNETCNITTRTKLYNQTTDEYYIVFRFTEQQTSEIGKFEGKVNVSFDNGNKLILPVKEKLYINIF
jgi:hypothetical protein